MTRPKPISDPHTGHYRVDVSFRIVPHPRVDAGGIRRAVYDVLENDLASTEGVVSDLDVAVSEIGAGGETSEDEGRYDRPSALGNTDDIEHAHPVTDIQAEGQRL